MSIRYRIDPPEPARTPAEMEEVFRHILQSLLDVMVLHDSEDREIVPVRFRFMKDSQTKSIFNKVTEG